MEIFKKIESWAVERNLISKGNEVNQIYKSIEELAELAEVIEINGSDSDFASEGGGLIVTVINILLCRGIDPLLALELEYERIATRKGKTKNGTFVKSGKSNSKSKGYKILIEKIKELQRIENLKNKNEKIK